MKGLMFEFMTRKMFKMLKIEACVCYKKNVEPLKKYICVEIVTLK